MLSYWPIPFLRFVDETKKGKHNKCIYDINLFWALKTDVSIFWFNCFFFILADVPACFLFFTCRFYFYDKLVCALLHYDVDPLLLFLICYSQTEFFFGVFCWKCAVVLIFLVLISHILGYCSDVAYWYFDLLLNFVLVL